MPVGSGPCSESTASVMSAWPVAVSSIFCTDPIGTPPACTGLPFTICPALMKRAVTV